MPNLYSNSKKNQRGATSLGVILLSAFVVGVTAVAIVGETSISFWSLALR